MTHGVGVRELEILAPREEASVVARTAHTTRAKNPSGEKKWNEKGKGDEDDGDEKASACDG